MSLSKPEVQKALLKVFDGWVEQQATMEAESAVLWAQAQAAQDQSPASNGASENRHIEVTARKIRALRAMGQALDTAEGEAH